MRAAPRRQALFDARGRLNGVDFVEVRDGPSLCVHFFGEVPPLRDAEHPHGLTVADVVVRGGRRIRDIRVLRLDVERADRADRDDCLRVTIDRVGDLSRYELCLAAREHLALDTRYTCAGFAFHPDHPAGTDCAPEPCRPPAPEPGPEVDHLAKDYASFRRLMLDRLAVTLPDRRERHEADVGVTLVELLAYVADHLSYHQDAVATEAYLDTARRRISVRRHARLVDHRLHEGLNARAWVTVRVDADTPPVPAGEAYFVTATGDPRHVDGRVLRDDDLREVPPERYLVFEPVGDPDAVLRFRAAHDEIAFHTWGGLETELPAGATHATLSDPGRALRLAAGDVLVLEEVKGVRTGRPADADPGRRHAVRLTTVTAAEDELLGHTVVDVGWAPADALPFALRLQVCLPAPDCTVVDGVAVARGNVVLVDHGRTHPQVVLGTVDRGRDAGDCTCEGAVAEVTRSAVRFTPVLPGAPVTSADPYAPDAPASAAGVRDPRAALPQILLTDGRGEWRPQPDLLAAGPDDPSFVAEIDDDGRAHLRFGDGELGRAPEAGATFRASYRTGNGTAGDVGREAITTMVLRTTGWSGVTVRPRNPIAASGGLDPEPVAQARLLAPDAFRHDLVRAVTAEDYAAIAARQPGVQGAAAELVWNGSWYEAVVAVDAQGTGVPGAELLARVGAALQGVRRIGHDVRVVPATPVPVELGLAVCVDPYHSAGAVRDAVRAVLAAMFAPDALTFGTSVRASVVVAAVQALDGVVSVEVTTLRRLGEPDAGELDAGVLRVRGREIVRLSGDPDTPEDGRIVLRTGGGR